jgi:hypothetical protein
MLQLKMRSSLPLSHEKLAGCMVHNQRHIVPRYTRE